MDLFARQLKRDLVDPYRPTFCTSCILQYLHANVVSVRDEELQANVQFWRRKHPDMLRGVMNYMTAPRSHEEILILHVSLENAIRTCRDRADHAPMHFDSLATPNRAVVALSQLILASMAQCSIRLFVVQRFTRPSTWPRRIDDLLPRGPRDALHAFLFWITWASNKEPTSLHWAVLDLFKYILILCRPEVMPELMAPPFRRAFVEAICRVLDVASSVRRTTPDSPHAMFTIESAASLLDGLSTGQGVQPDTWRRVVQGMGHRALNSLDAALACFDPGVESTNKQALVALQVGIYMQLQEPIPVHIHEAFIGRHTRYVGTVYSRLYDLIDSVSVGVCCYAQDCSRHQRELETGKLRRCGSCRIFQYCSRECQKRHWTRDPVPHKGACGTLRAVCDVAPLSLGKDGFEAACRASPHPEAVFVELERYLYDERGVGHFQEESIKLCLPDGTIRILPPLCSSWLDLEPESCSL